MGLGKKSVSPADALGGRQDGARQGSRRKDDCGKDGCCKGGGQRRAFARFKALYENKRSGLCLFEDEHGHLTAVDAKRLV